MILYNSITTNVMHGDHITVHQSSSQPPTRYTAKRAPPRRGVAATSRRVTEHRGRLSVSSELNDDKRD